MPELAKFTEELSPLPYAPEDVADLIVSSFRFSRGNLDVQAAILSFIAVNFGSKFTDGIVDVSLETAIEKAAAIIANERAHPQLSQSSKLIDKRPPRVIARSGILTITPEFTMYLSGYKQPETIEDLAKGLVEVDLRWLEGSSPFHTPIPYKSNVLHYGFAGRPTGMAEYDLMFRQAAEALANGSSELDAFCLEYTRKHPERAEFIEAARARDFSQEAA